MDVLVLMSLREGFPNVVLEAAALEVPSIVSNATGCIDSVIDGQTGLIVPVGNLDGLSNAIKKLSTDAELRAKLGINARNWVTKEFDQEIVFKNLVDYIMKRTKNKK
jgi:glycosyltransferase involved in cell wall biosynthesis